MPQSEAELIERARDGDRDALSELLEQVEPTIYRFAMKLCRHPEDARGVLQETMITMARSLEGFRGDASLSSWLYAVARSHCARKRRRSKFAPERIESLEREARAAAEGIASDEPAPDEEIERRRLTQALEAALHDLRDEHREVLILRDVEGLTAPEVAGILELSVPAVKSRLHRARAALREAMAPVLGDQPVGPACPDIVEAFSRNLEGDLTARDCRSMQEHVDRCPRCKSACDALRATLAVCSASGPGEVPENIKKEVMRAVLSALGDRP
jgi:RNA polymerase sigma-70 factor, ECF subfamily